MCVTNALPVFFVVFLTIAFGVILRTFFPIFIILPTVSNESAANVPAVGPYLCSIRLTELVLGKKY